jgi:hypothetical protein
MESREVVNLGVPPIPKESINPEQDQVAIDFVVNEIFSIIDSNERFVSLRGYSMKVFYTGMNSIGLRKDIESSETFIGVSMDFLRLIHSYKDAPDIDLTATLTKAMEDNLLSQS